MDVPVDEGDVELLGLIQKQLILEYLVPCCESEMLPSPHRPVSGSRQMLW